MEAATPSFVGARGIDRSILWNRKAGIGFSVRFLQDRAAETLEKPPISVERVSGLCRHQVGGWVGSWKKAAGSGRPMEASGSVQLRYPDPPLPVLSLRRWQS